MRTLSRCLDIEIATNGIYISRDMSDNASGDGFVAFVNMDHAYKAIDLYDRSHMQHRFGRRWVFRGKRIADLSSRHLMTRKRKQEEQVRREVGLFIDVGAVQNLSQVETVKLLVSCL